MNNHQGQQRLKQNLNRLAIITFALVLLKVLTYFFQDFLPVFSQVLSKLFSAFLPFILAFLLALLLEPLVTRLMRLLRLRRPYASLIALIIGIIILGILIFFICARLYTELSELAVSLPNYGSLLGIINLQVDAVENFIEVNPQIQETLNNSTQGLINSLQEWALAGSRLLLNILAALPGIFIVLVVSIVATLLMSSSYPDVKRLFRKLLPRKWLTSAQTIGEDLGAAIFGFVRAEAILISVTGIILTTGLVVLGNRYAFTLGFTAAFLDLLPIVGTGIIFVPWIIGLFIMGSVSEGVKILLLWLLATVIRQILEPKVMSQSIGLHPLPTIISMYVGLKLLGGVGLILGPGLVIIYEALRKAGIFTDPKE